MKDEYSISIKLRCITCGGEEFEYNDDKSFVKCALCNREYLGGYDELVEFNEEAKSETIESIKSEIESDLKKELSDILKNAFKRK